MNESLYLNDICALNSPKKTIDFIKYEWFE